MANELSKFFGDKMPADVNKMRAAAEALGDTVRQYSGKPLLRLDQDRAAQYDGQGWVMGADNEEPPKTLIAVPSTFQSGWIAWHRSEIEGERMFPLFNVPPDAGSQLPPVDAKNGWEAQLSVEMVDGKGLELLYKVSSKGGIEAIARLASEWALANREDARKMFPVVEISTSSYYSKDNGKTIYKPVFKIVKWLDETGEEVTERASLV